MAEIEEVAIQIDDQPEISTKTNKGTKKLKGDEDSNILVEELHNSMEKRLSALPGKPLRDRSLTIFRLPDWIHENNKELCEPKLVAIGPYHHGKQSLQTMEEHKWYTLRNFLARMKVDLKVCLQAMISIEAQARNCYSETEKIGSDDFVMMLLLDACFILEWFSPMYGCGDVYLTVGWALSDLLSDMLLQENQIPFFVIHKLFAIVEGGNVSERPNCEGQCPLVKLFSDVLIERSYLTQFKSSEITCKRVDHLLHLCYTGMVPDPLPQTQSDQGNSDANKSNNICGFGSVLWSRLNSNCCKAKKERSIPTDLVDAGLPSLSELHDAGIKFKRKKDPTSMLDISFKNGTMEMPFLQMEVPKIRILWNMVAFEQSCMPRGLPQTLSSYLALMDTLINTEKDISILERSGILDNLFQNAEEAATFFNQFDKIFSLNYSNHYFKGLFEDIREYSQSTWHKHRARLMQDYFSNPWSIISVVAAGILLVLTILQTYYSAAN